MLATRFDSLLILFLFLVRVVVVQFEETVKYFAAVGKYP